MRGLFARFKEGLTKTRQQFTEAIAQSLLGKQLTDAKTLDEIETHLLLADVGVKATDKIIQHLMQTTNDESAPQDLMQSLQQALTAILTPVSKPLVVEGHHPYIILMVGINGAGKTTTIGKLAKQLQNEGKKVMLAAGDTFRAAAIEQLQAWGDRNQIPVISGDSGGDSAAIIYDTLQAAKARQIDVVIADTAGRLHTQHHLMDELAKIKRVIGKFDSSAPHEIMLVLDAGSGQNALQQAKQFQKIIDVSGITLTKLDGTAKGGIVFAVAEELQIPIRFLGMGEGIDDLRPFDVDDFVQALLSLQKDKRMIICQHVAKTYTGGFAALHDIHFELPRGKMAFLTGHSGAGKSTLLKLIALIERPSRGQIIVNGFELNKVNGHQLPYFRRSIGVIFQDHRLLMDRTVFDNVALPLIIAGYRHQDIKKRVHAALDKVGLLRFVQRYPVSLSGGEQQRVGIARAVVNKPSVLLADEPTGNLDPVISTDIMGLFSDFNQVGVTVLIASHDLALIGRMNVPVLSIEQGRMGEQK